MGDDGAPDEKQRQLQRLGQLLAALGVDIAAQAAAREAANGAAADVQQQGQQQHKVYGLRWSCVYCREICVVKKIMFCLDSAVCKSSLCSAA